MNFILFIVTLISPFLSLFVHIILFFLKKLSLSLIFSLSLVQAILVLTRSVPICGADDLHNYFLFYKIIPDLEFFEFFVFFRFEPVLYSLYFLLSIFNISIHGVLFFNSFITLFFFNLSFYFFINYLKLPHFLFSLVVIFTPYELISNTPRLVLAMSFLLICIVHHNKFLNFILSILTHKLTFFLFLLYRFSRYKILMSLLLLTFFVFKETLLSNLNYPIVYRLVYYLNQDSSSFSYFYLILSILFLVLSACNKRSDIKFILLFSLFLSLLGFIFSPFGSLSIRLCCFLPILSILCFLSVFKFKLAQLRLIFISLTFPLLYLRLFHSVSPNSHDLFSSNNYFFLLPWDSFL